MKGSGGEWLSDAELGLKLGRARDAGAAPLATVTAAPYPPLPSPPSQMRIGRLVPVLLAAVLPLAARADELRQLTSETFEASVARGQW